MSKHFTHLHLHSDYSLLDGAITIDRLVQFGVDNKLKALAITDHGNIFGAVKFFQKCKQAGIKPVLGMEAYLAETITDKKAEKKYYHLILLVQNEVGYKNLCKLISFSFQKGFYFKPRIDYEILKQHSEGLIALSACLGGHIPKLLMNNEHEKALERIQWFVEVFGKERFYLELQPEDQQEQTILNEKLIAASKQTGVQLVATGDCHYPTLDDHEAHEVMLSIGTHDSLDNPNRYSFGDCRTYIRTPEEMLKAFPNNPEALWNSGAIADLCTFDFQTDKLFFPKCSIPEQHTAASYFKELCLQGLETLIEKKRIDTTQKELYLDRLNVEIDLIIDMGFTEYFLIVSDFIQWARRNGIPVGPGRGSAAGALVAWCLEITNIDPIKYNLLFERFLNPERVSMPDIDIDFCIEGREAVINYVKEKYGHDKVCQIITFGTMLAKGVIKDVARVLGFSFEDSNAITNLIPDQLKITLKEAIEQEPKLQELIDNNPRIHKLFSIAFKLEGITRHASKHAAGIVITPEPVDEVLPLYIPPKTKDLVAQYAMTELESIGFLKIDLLGLKNLTLIDKTITLIKQNRGIQLDIDGLPLDDPKAFELICQGKTSGVFQLESEGLKEVLRKLQPDKFEDIIAVNALYRPGPLGSGMVDDYIERRHGRQAIPYLFEELTPILKETYGVIVYQEQVMKIASTIGGYSLGEADILRRAMGKKKADVMAKQRELFLTRSKEHQFDEKKAGELFDLMAYFAGYGFNKSHSAAYALIAYQTAYLKANYTAEFMASLISLETNNAEKMAFYLEDAKAMGLTILPPDIATSEINFSVLDTQTIRFGLQGIKSVGTAALENIIQERTKKPYLDLLDMCTRIDLRTANKRVLENLICAGAFDSFPGNRSQQYEELSRIIDCALEKKRELTTGQMGLFSQPQHNNDAPAVYSFQDQAEWSDKEKLAKEKEVVGFYLSSHPLDTYKKMIRRLSVAPFETILNKAQSHNAITDMLATGCGLLKTVRIITTKKGDKMAFAQLEDTSSSAEIVIFPQLFKKVELWLTEYQVFVVKGGVDTASLSKCKIKANEMVPIELLLQEWGSPQKATFILPSSFQQQLIETIHTALPKGTVPLSLIFRENDKLLQLHTKQKIALSEEYLALLEESSIQIKISL